MGVYVICTNCGNRVYVSVLRKSRLPPTFPLTCYQCGTSRTHLMGDAIEERWSFSCIMCSGRFYTLRPPPSTLRCPHCRSLVSVEFDGRIVVLEQGRIPVPAPGTRPAAGAVGGLIVGGLIAGPLGALLGMLAGGAIGASVEELEAVEA